MKTWANILLGARLVAGSLMSLFNIRFTGSSVILAVLGVSAGVKVLIARRWRFMRRIVRDWIVRGQAWLIDLPQGALPDHSSVTYSCSITRHAVTPDTRLPVRSSFPCFTCIIFEDSILCVTR